jgi:uncharacterized protein YijF (DUF1287 family)
MTRTKITLSPCGYDVIIREATGGKATFRRVGRTIQNEQGQTMCKKLSRVGDVLRHDGTGSDFLRVVRQEYHALRQELVRDMAKNNDFYSEFAGVFSADY